MLLSINSHCHFVILFITIIIIFINDYYISCYPFIRSKRAFSYIANDTACTVDNIVYKNGDPIPTDDPCETCRCRPPGFICVLQHCEIKTGCRAIRHIGECCPTYQCGCEHNGQYYKDGERIHNAESPCYSCYCQGSSITCSLADCQFRFDCEPEYVLGECCPRYDHCPLGYGILPNGETVSITNDQIPPQFINPPNISHYSPPTVIDDSNNDEEPMIRPENLPNSDDGAAESEFINEPRETKPEFINEPRETESNDTIPTTLSPSVIEATTMPSIVSNSVQDSNLRKLDIEIETTTTAPTTTTSIASTEKLITIKNDEPTTESTSISDGIELTTESDNQMSARSNDEVSTTKSIPEVTDSVNDTNTVEIDRTPTTNKPELMNISLSTDAADDSIHYSITTETSIIESRSEDILTMTTISPLTNLSILNETEKIEVTTVASENDSDTTTLKP